MPTLWDACLAAGEARDLPGTAALVRQWYGAEEGEGAGAQQLEDAWACGEAGAGSAQQQAQQALQSAQAVSQAEEEALRIFALPPIPPRGTLVYNPQLLGPGSTAAAAAAAAAERAATAAAASAAEAAAAAAVAAAQEEAAQAAAAALAQGPPPPSLPALRPTDDAFGRVVLGDSPSDVQRRGEGYMFWCMDRPTQGAGLLPVPPAGAGAAAAAASAAASAASLPPGWSTGVDGASGEPVLIAMMAGDAAQWVEDSSDEEVVASVLEALRSMFGAGAVPPPVAQLITRWRRDPFARGSYSNIPPGAHGMHYDVMAAPVGGAVLWAGEATNRHHPTTAAGAFDSGLREAHRLAGLYGRSRDCSVVALLAARAARLAAVAAAGGRA